MYQQNYQNLFESAPVLLRFLFTEDSLKIKMGLELVSRPYFSYNFLIKNFFYINWSNFITRLCLLPKLFNKMCFVLYAQAFDEVIIIEYLKNENLIISRTKRAFELKQKTFFLISKALSFSRTKETSKNLTDTTFKSRNQLLYLSFGLLECSLIKYFHLAPVWL